MLSRTPGNYRAETTRASLTLCQRGWGLRSGQVVSWENVLSLQYQKQRLQSLFVAFKYMGKKALTEQTSAASNFRTDLWSVLEL